MAGAGRRGLLLTVAIAGGLAIALATYDLALSWTGSATAAADVSACVNRQPGGR